MDDLKQCSEKVGKLDNRNRSKPYFPFKLGYLSVMTLRVGEEGFHMTVDGKHITSFAYREVLFSTLKVSIFFCNFLTFYDDLIGFRTMACE